MSEFATRAQRRAAREHKGVLCGLPIQETLRGLSEKEVI